jgi:3-methyladenine DNA glycosylase Tag
MNIGDIGLKPFAEIYDRAARRKGGEKELEKMIRLEMKTAEELAKIPDDRYLAEITRGVFNAGFVWKIIEHKWGGFETAFWKFNVMRCAYMSDEDIDQLCEDERIVRNRQKITTVRNNAVMVFELSSKHGSFGKMVGDWPDEDYIGLLALLKNRGSRLGGLTPQYFLRRMGKSGFVLGRDGTAALVDAGVIDKFPTGKADMQNVQEAYNQWMEESGLSLAQISRVLSLSLDSV